MKKTIILLILSIILKLSFSQTTVILQPGADEGKDARIHSLDTYTSGDAYKYVAKAWTYNGNPGIERSLIEFNLSQIPANAQIITAKLSLYDPQFDDDHHSILSGTNTAVLQRITSSWDESSVTWDNQPGTTEENQVVLNEIAEYHKDCIDINVTTLVQDMIDNPNSGFGFMFKLQTEDYYRSMVFASSDHPDSTKHPKLEICYNDSESIPEPVIDDDYQIGIYPNPTNETIYIQSNYTGKVYVEITDIDGKLVFKKNFGILPEKINVSSLSQAIYIINIKTDKKIVSKKFVKVK